MTASIAEQQATYPAANRYYTSAGAARLLNISSGTVKGYIGRGYFPAPDVVLESGNGGKTVYGWSRRTLEQWASGRPVAHVSAAK